MPSQVLHGSYEVSLDDKGRVTLPAKFRRVFEDDRPVYLVRLARQDPCIRVYDEEAWKAFEAKHIEDLDEFTHEEDRWVLKDIYSNMDEVEPDRQGRVRVRADFIRELALSGRLKVIGVRDHLEIWNPETYETEREKMTGGGDGA